MFHRRKPQKEVKPPAKRKVQQSAAAKKTEESWRAFDSESEDETICKEAQLKSSYSKRVADGVVRRSIQLEGDLYLDLKLYQVADIKKIDPRKRYEKAVLALKFQADFDSPELGVLRQLLKSCKRSFTEEGVFFADKKN